MSEPSPEVRFALEIAVAEARHGGHSHIESVHLLMGLLSLEKVVRAELDDVTMPLQALAALHAARASIDIVFRNVGLQPKDLRRALRQRAGRGAGSPTRISRSPACKVAMARADTAAADKRVTALHLLSVLLQEPDPVTREVLAERQVDLPKLLKAMRAAAGVEGPAARRAAVSSAAAGGGPAHPPTPTLDRFGRDLTRLALRGELGPLIGRREQLLRVIQTLARSSKSNPLLVGEAGVGKTAIVEAIATRAAAGKDPTVLGGVRIVELNLGALIGGTEHRGELEQRLTGILGEAEADPGLILFIDEIHTVVGAGRVGPNGADAADLMKPALARGGLRVIGATTTEGFRRHIESDPALERRFEKIDVPEPSRSETLTILRGLRDKWERHHEVAIEDAALEAAVALSVRFDIEHHLPDKAVDLIDKAAARSRVPTLSMSAPRDSFESDLTPAVAVTPRTVAEVLAEKRGLPLGFVSEAVGEPGAARILELDGFLKDRMVGQDRAIERAAERLQVAFAGFAARSRPLAVMLFIGPTGVGKTEMARLLAEFLFGSADELVSFDMSEYMEEHSVAKLLGAPPGYKGYGEEGQLAARLRRKPHCVVLLDEVEKAHRRIFDVFLQVFDEGRVTDSTGRVADARHAIFALTSNLGAAGPKARPGFGEPSAAGPADELERAALEQARAFFGSELLNRIDEILVFRPLVDSDVERIASRALARLAAELRERLGVTLHVRPEVATLVTRQGFSASLGARELQRAVERLVRAPLAQLALSGRLALHPAWSVIGSDGEVHVVPGGGPSGQPGVSAMGTGSGGDA